MHLLIKNLPKCSTHLNFHILGRNQLIVTRPILLRLFSVPHMIVGGGVKPVTKIPLKLKVENHRNSQKILKTLWLTKFTILGVENEPRT